MNAQQIENEVVVRAILISATDEKVELAIPHTDYRLHLVPAVPASVLSPHIGKRIKGVIHAEALRIHATSGNTGGGRFIEPVIGMPRIVAGRIKSLDREADQLIVDVSVPITVKPLPEQDWSILEVGNMVNFYVESGATFSPVTAVE